MRQSQHGEKVTTIVQDQELRVLYEMSFKSQCNNRKYHLGKLEDAPLDEK